MSVYMMCAGLVMMLSRLIDISLSLYFYHTNKEKTKNVSFPFCKFNFGIMYVHSLFYANIIKALKHAGLQRKRVEKSLTTIHFNCMCLYMIESGVINVESERQNT